MILNGIGMIAADTSRTKVYLQSLLAHDLIPGFVLLLKPDSDVILPGQLKAEYKGVFELKESKADDIWSESHYDLSVPVEYLLDKFAIQYKISPSANINDVEVVNLLHDRPESVFIYSGYGGVLLRKSVLSVGKQFLHVHGGYLPDFKGSTTNYYSMILENTLGASAIFLSEEIDSGPVLMRKKFPIPLDAKLIDHLYDAAARAKVLVETIQNFLKIGDWSFDLKDNAGGETYYVIHPVLKHIAILQSKQ